MEKKCPFCLAMIDSNARKCSHCAEWVVGWNPSTKRTVFSILVIFGFVIGIKVFAFSLFSNFDDGRVFHAPINERIKILNHAPGSVGDATFFLGEIKNEGPDSKETFSITVQLFDKDNKLIDIGKDRIYTGFSSGEVRPFKITFGNCSEKKKVSYDHYEIKIIK